MKSWIKELSGVVYWLVTASVYQEAVEQLLSIEEATPLFEGKEYDDVITLTPWLVPVSSLVDLNYDLLHKGMILASDAAMHEVVAHLRSLLIAGLDGEEVLFRFYDSQVIMPMLAQMNETDRHRLFGNLNSWACIEQSENHDLNITTYSMKPHPNFKVNDAPWWVIKAEHFSEKINVVQLAHHIERRLWATLPQVINDMSEPKQKLISILQEAQKARLNLVDSQLMVLANLIVYQHVPVEMVSQAMLLSWDEEKRLQNLLEDMA